MLMLNCHNPNSPQNNITKVGFDTKMTLSTTHHRQLNDRNISAVTAASLTKL